MQIRLKSQDLANVLMLARQFNWLQAHPDYPDYGKGIQFFAGQNTLGIWFGIGYQRCLYATIDAECDEAYSFAVDKTSLFKELLPALSGADTLTIEIADYQVSTNQSALFKLENSSVDLETYRTSDCGSDWLSHCIETLTTGQRYSYPLKAFTEAMKLCSEALYKIFHRKSSWAGTPIKNWVLIGCLLSSQGFECARKTPRGTVIYSYGNLQDTEAVGAITPLLAHFLSGLQDSCDSAEVIVDGGHIKSFKIGNIFVADAHYTTIKRRKPTIADAVCTAKVSRQDLIEALTISNDRFDADVLEKIQANETVPIGKRLVFLTVDEGTRQRSNGTLTRSNGTLSRSIGTRQRSNGTLSDPLGTRQRSNGTLHLAVDGEHGLYRDPSNAPNLTDVVIESEGIPPTDWRFFDYYHFLHAVQSFTSDDIILRFSDDDVVTLTGQGILPEAVISYTLHNSVF